MMEYLIIENNIITNIIVCENEEIASQFNAVSSYEGANIGDEYNPPIIIKKLSIDEYVKASNYLELVKSGKFDYNDIDKVIQEDIKLVALDKLEDGSMTQEEFDSIFNGNE